MKPFRSSTRRRRNPIVPSRKSILLTVASIVLLPASALAAATLLWGHSPSLVCLLHGELAKEGLALDVNQNSFSVGFEDINGFGLKKGLLQVRDVNGAVRSHNLVTLNPTKNCFLTGVWVQPSGASAFTVGTQLTGNASNPANVIVTRWLQGGGTPWTSPVNAQTVMLTPTMLGLFGAEAWGCRVIKASAAHIYISGCTEDEIFVAKLDKSTLSLVTAWGVNGVQSVASGTATGCPQHNMPGGFVDFAFYRQSFVEFDTLTSRVYLGGTLLHMQPGNPPGDYDFVAACYDANTGALVGPFNVQRSSSPGDEYMKAMAATPTGLYAVGTFDPFNQPQMQLIAWRFDGTIRPPGIVRGVTPSRGNDVEANVGQNRTHVFVGGYGLAGGFNGAVWHYVHLLPYASPIVLPALWAGNNSGPNPQAYGPNLDPADEVFDIALGKGLPYNGYTFASGAAHYGAGAYGQPLQSIDPLGSSTFSANPTPVAPADDRAVAVVFDTHAGGKVFTHGTVYDPGPNTWLNCPQHWSARSSKFQP